jgi:hypothetical protein
MFFEVGTCAGAQYFLKPDYPSSSLAQLMKKYLILSILCVLPLFAMAQEKQFTGSVTISTHQVNSNGEAVNTREMPIVMSPTRIRIPDLDKLGSNQVLTTIGTNDMLIRLDQEDFIFMRSATEGIQIKKAELQGMMTFMAGMQGNTAAQPQTRAEMDIRQTTESKQINGVEAVKWVVKEKGSVIENFVWISDDFNVNWGMLTESWASVLPGVNILPATDLISGGKTPVRVETFNNGKLVSVVEVKNINANIDSKLLEVPQGVKIITMQEMMLNRMRNY